MCPLRDDNKIYVYRSIDSAEYHLGVAPHADVILWALLCLCE